jgi:mRNA-degrading endonuclease toxin of MazEF toxin-antitoxin module
VIASRADTTGDRFVAVLSNEIHLGADTGRVITCPFIPGPLPDGVMAMVVAVSQPDGVLLPELVQWLPTAALGDEIGSTGVTALQEAASIVCALIT